MTKEELSTPLKEGICETLKFEPDAPDALNVNRYDNVVEAACEIKLAMFYLMDSVLEGLIEKGIVADALGDPGISVYEAIETMCKVIGCKEDEYWEFIDEVMT